MPPKSKARSSRRAQVAGSDDEDDQMHDVQPSSSKNRSAAASGRKKSRRAQSDDEDIDEEAGHAQSRAPVAQEEEDLVLFDPATFGDQPLDSAYAERKIASFMNDWSTLEGKLGDMFTILEGAAEAVEEHQEGDKGVSLEYIESLSDNSLVDASEPQTVDKLDASMRDLLDVRQELQGYQSVLARLRREAAQNDDIANRYEKGTKEQLNTYRQQSARQKYGKVKEYIHFREMIWEVNHANEAMPPVRSQIAREEGDSDSDGSDIEVGGATQNFTCSLSLKPFVDPMTSKICGHSFSREALEDYFKQQRRGGHQAKCPASGCNKNLSLADFAINKDLAKRTNAAERRRRRKAIEDQEDDESMDVV
ncbi:hypothetical protein FRC01_004070 [Tulasnella sp. 417]|nr:hypothetical protein FRC01_004070 [Tulasnella sp. 417]